MGNWKRVHGEVIAELVLGQNLKAEIQFLQVQKERVWTKTGVGREGEAKEGGV